jgi:hypothetical protein
VSAPATTSAAPSSPTPVFPSDLISLNYRKAFNRRASQCEDERHEVRRRQPETAVASQLSIQHGSVVAVADDENGGGSSEQWPGRNAIRGSRTVLSAPGCDQPHRTQSESCSSGQCPRGPPRGPGMHDPGIRSARAIPTRSRVSPNLRNPPTRPTSHPAGIGRLRPDRTVRRKVADRCRSRSERPNPRSRCGPRCHQSRLCHPSGLIDTAVKALAVLTRCRPVGTRAPWPGSRPVDNHILPS